MKTTIIHTIRRGISGKSSLRRWPLAAVLVVLLLAVTVSPSVAGSPHSAFYSSDNDRIFWFIHASDLHVGTSGSTDSTNLQWLVTTAKNTINPSFIVVTGDLTDSTNGNLLGYPNGPYQAEWDQYKGIVDGNVTASTTSTSRATTTPTMMQVSPTMWPTRSRAGQRAANSTPGPGASPSGSIISWG